MFNRQIVTALAVFALSAPVMAYHSDNSRNQDHKDSKGYHFALIGDTPYGVPPYSDYPPFDNLIDALNDRQDLRWVIHTGDIKSGSSECSDALFEDRLARYNQIKMPFIYTPGDNEWTDCHRVKAGEYQPLERLSRLREIFFAEPGKTIGGKPRRVETQATLPGYEEFPENVRWSKQGVIFAALHVVGSNNGLAPFDPASAAVRTDQDDAEAARRIEAAVAWIHDSFDQAERTRAPGILFMMQANPVLEVGYALPSGDALAAARLGFTEILEALEQRTLQFGKPVVLAHGDSHYFRVDKPGLIANSFVPNFTRVENFGDQRVHWVDVQVDPDSPEVFRFQPMIIEANR
ncbi:MAG: metallophosphoesterase [Candidatus Thiodiazotropha sp.]